LQTPNTFTTFAEKSRRTFGFMRILVAGSGIISLLVLLLH